MDKLLNIKFKLLHSCLIICSDLGQHPVKIIVLTLILLTPKVTSLCHHYRARPARTSMQSDQALYCWLTNFFTSLHLDIPENGNG